jgi:hypothetical protein
MQNYFQGPVGAVYNFEATSGTVTINNAPVLGPQSTRGDFLTQVEIAKAQIEADTAIPTDAKARAKAELEAAGAAAKASDTESARTKLQSAADIIEGAGKIVGKVFGIVQLLVAIGAWAAKFL